MTGVYIITYIFSADITLEMPKLCRLPKVKVFFLVLVYVFNFDFFEFVGRHFGEGSICLNIVK